MTDKGQIIQLPQYSLQLLRHESSVFAENPLCTRHCEKHFTFSGHPHNGSLRHILNPWLEDRKTKPHAIRERVEKQTVLCTLHYLCPCTLHPCTLFPEPCSLHHCTLHPAFLYPHPCTLILAPCIPAPSSLHPHPCTLHPCITAPCILNPCTLIPAPYILAPCIPAPCILHPCTLIPAPYIPVPSILASQIDLHSFSRCSNNIHTRLMTVLKVYFSFFKIYNS